MEHKLITISIATVVAVIVLAGTLMPVLNEATAKSDTFVNEGYFYVDTVEDGESITYIYENGSLRINGAEVPLPTGSQYPDGLTVLYTESMCIRYDAGYMKLRGSTGNHNCSYIDLTIADGSITGYWQSGDTPVSVDWTYTEFYGMVNHETNRIMCKSIPQYVKADSIISTTGLSNPSFGWMVINLEGSIAEGMTITLRKQADGTIWPGYTVENIEINYSAVEGYNDLYRIESITFDISDGSTTSPAMYTIYTIPSEITAEKLDPMDDGQASILKSIPVIIILAILLMVVGVIMRRDQF